MVARDASWDIDYIRAVLYRDIVLFYLIILAAWVAGNLVFLRSRPPVRKRSTLAHWQALHDSGYLTDAERDVMVEGAKKAAKGVFSSSSVEEVPAQGQTLQEI